VFDHPLNTVQTPCKKHAFKGDQTDDLQVMDEEEGNTEDAHNH
jgi:hypothetical protein